MLADRDRKADYLRFQVSDIDAAAPRDGEVEELQARLPRLRHGERLTSRGGRRVERAPGRGWRIRLALVRLLRACRREWPRPRARCLGEVLVHLDVEVVEVSASLRTYTEGVEHDPAALDETERRLQQLSDLQRKYGPTIERCAADSRGGSARARAARGGRGRPRPGACRVRGGRRGAARCGDDADRCPRRGSSPVHRPSRRCCRRTCAPNASFEVASHRSSSTSWTSEGPERVEFLFASGPGESPRPLAKVASGGEVSRVMLALKSVLGDRRLGAGARVRRGGCRYRRRDRSCGRSPARRACRSRTRCSWSRIFRRSRRTRGDHIVVEKAVTGERTVTTARADRRRRARA